jgi:SPP1 family predicted phage head-tail adaptor
MRAGDLDRQIELQSFEFVDDGGGGGIETWTTYATVAAAVLQTGGCEFLSAGATTAERRVVFRLRWRAGVSTAHRVVYAGQVHDIHEVRELDRRAGLELHTTAS